MIILLFIGLKNGIENAAKNSILIILLFLGLKNGINPKERDFLNFVCFWNCQTFWYSFNQSLHHMDRAKVVLGLELSWTYSQSDSHKKAGHSPVRNGEKGWFPPPFTRDVPLEKETNLRRPRVTSSLQIVQGHIQVIFFTSISIYQVNPYFYFSP